MCAHYNLPRILQKIIWPFFRDFLVKLFSANHPPSSCLSLQTARDRAFQDMLLSEEKDEDQREHIDYVGSH
jgi:hypothetical protein